MVVCINDSQHKQFYFENFPQISLSYQDVTPSMASDLIPFQITDKKTGKVVSVAIKEVVLRDKGISPRVWKNLTHNPTELIGMIKNTVEIDRRLEMAATVASKHLSDQFLKFFTQRKYASRAISWFLYGGVEHSSKIKNVPGLYFHEGKSSVCIFINLKKSSPLGAGGFGKVKKAIWLTAPSEGSMLVAKKVFNGKSKESILCFNREILAHNTFSDKRGIISALAGKNYHGKHAIFLPIYECDLSAYLKRKPFSLTVDERLNVIAQWLEGLATISEKGVHGDISLKNLLLKRTDGGKVEAVISDFGGFCPLGQEKCEVITVCIGSPEYFAKKSFTLKQDVWSMGIALHEMFSDKRLPCWGYDENAMVKWTSTLKPGWILTYKTQPKTPQFLLDLINVMLDPRADFRPSAKEVFERFSKGQVGAPITKT